VHLLFIIKEIDNEPHGIMHISALLKQEGHQTSLAVATEEDPVEAALRLKPDVVGYTVYTGTQNYYLDLNRQIKAQLPGVFSIFGGPHPTFFPEMIEHEEVDGICVGEGEYAILDLLNALQAGAEIVGIPNWHFKLARQGGGVGVSPTFSLITPSTDRSKVEIIRNPVRPLLTSEQLDELPFPDRDLLYDVHPASQRNKIRPFITGRGCPYSCTYCFNKAYRDLYRGLGKAMRRRSVEDVIREIKAVRKRYPLEFITFMDDTFILNRQWLQKFAVRYKAEVGLPFWCQVRADLVTDEMMALFKDAGCVSVSFGLEAGNDRLRNAVLKRDMSREQILDASRIFRQHGIAFMTNNMLGLPAGSLETDFETLELNVQCRPSYANVFLFQPYPKTELGEWACREGWMTGSFDDLSGSVSDDTILRFGSESEKRQIENLQKLFALAVEFPFLVSLVKLLIKLPRNKLFWLIYKIWKGYAIKRRMFPFRLTPREYMSAAWQYMRIHSQ
jgi:anaerobic magnesium-protoporphyrin IX monomethyl ester cyclase